MVSTMLPAKSRRSWSRPLRPTASTLTVLPSAISARMVRRASRTIELLKAPHRPRSAVATISRWTLSEPVPASSLGPVPPLKEAPSDAIRLSMASA